MATPTDSAAPDAPNGPSPIAGIRKLWQWFTAITDWIKLLSPNGATAYDTGWVDCTLLDTSKIDVYTAGNKIQVRRIGKQVYLDGVGKAVTAGILATLTDLPFATVPAGFRPRGNIYCICQGSSYERWLLSITPAGNLQASRYSGTQGANAWLPMQTSWAVA